MCIYSSAAHGYELVAPPLLEYLESLLSLDLNAIATRVAGSAGSTFAAQYLNSGIFPNGSSAGLVIRLSASGSSPASRATCAFVRRFDAKNRHTLGR